MKLKYLCLNKFGFSPFSTFASKPIKLMQINIDLLNNKVSDNNYN